MEIPATALLYAVILAGGAAAMLYVFTLYDGAVYDINLRACYEAATLLKLMTQRAGIEPGNYTAYVEFYYPLTIEAAGDKVLITVGRDSRAPAQCEINTAELTSAAPGIEILSGTGTRAVLEKTVKEWASCQGDLPAPRLARQKRVDSQGREYYIYTTVTKCQNDNDIEVEKPEIVLYLK
ncbi:MAG: hypothetical protein ACPL3C_11300 [Pyrobaculum sp.]